ncbi:hypothetical protein C0J52_18140, partial [Blattella germanica]
SFVYQTPVDDPETLIARIFEASGEILHIPGVFEGIRQRFLRTCNACIQCGGLSEHLL